MPEGKKHGRGLWFSKGDLQVLAQPFYFLNEEVDVRLGGRWVGDDHPEEVGFVPLGLVANHGCPRLHHQGFDLGSHLVVENIKSSSALMVTPPPFIIIIILTDQLGLLCGICLKQQKHF